MFKIREVKAGAVLPVTAVVFSIGVILGTTALYYIPKEFVTEAREGLNSQLVLHEEFVRMWKSNFMAETLWIFAIWILGCASITAPFSGAVMSVRGFFIGFSVAFMLTGDNNGFKFIICYILPQAIVSLPVMTLTAIRVMGYAVERKHMQSSYGEYFICGALFICIAAASSAVQTLLTRIFITYL